MAKTDNRILGISLALFALIGCGSVEPGIEIPGDKPFAPSELIAQADDFTKVLLTWQDNSQIEERYIVERKKDSGGDFAEIGTTSRNVEEYEDSSIDPQESYTYRVRAANQTGFSDFSNEKGIEVPGTPPAAPTDLDFTSVSATHINLDWQQPGNDVTHFVLFRSVADGPFTVRDDHIAPTTTNLHDDNLSPSTNYCYIVEAVNEFGATASNDECKTTSPDNTG